MAFTDFAVAFITVTALCATRYSARDAVLFGTLLAVGFVSGTALYQGYRRRHIIVNPQELRSVLPVVGMLGTGSLVLNGLGVVEISPTMMLAALVLTATLTTLTRTAQRAIARRLRVQGRLTRRALLVGPAPSLRAVLDSHEQARLQGLNIVGTCAPDDAVPHLVAELAVEAVVVSADALDSSELRRLGWALRDQAVELSVLPPLDDVHPRRLRLEPILGTPLLAVTLTESRVQQLLKACVDRSVGTMILLAALPVIAVAGMAVRLTSPGPAFFAQTRIGLRGRPFTMYKLRSMYIDAEDRLAELRHLNEGNGLLFKMREDPRVTRVGKILRRVSIDELPQLWNVVKGDMSLVGPRPALPGEVAAYDGDTAQRLQVKPGLTGLWQVSGRSDLSAERSVRLDLRYADNWSVGMDLHILARTARAVVRGDGAY